jgi:hypothetical protein
MGEGPRLCVQRQHLIKGAAAGAHMHVMQFLHEEGCAWDSDVCAAAARYGHLTTLKWLHDQGCPWDPVYITDYAAASGSIEMLLYLQQQGLQFDEDTMSGAAGQGHLAVCQFLAGEGCTWSEYAAECAASSGHLSTLRWLHESGCPWESTTICAEAACSGILELLQYVMQQGGILSGEVMNAAEGRGYLSMCAFLHTEQCPWDTSTCKTAAEGGYVDTLRWLHEQGCPWDLHEIRAAAAMSGQIAVLTYLQDIEPAASAAELTELLTKAGAFSQLAADNGARYNGQFAAAKWLRQQGAEWPAVLKWGTLQWAGRVLQWARDEGCKSPTS